MGLAFAPSSAPGESSAQRRGAHTSWSVIGYAIVCSGAACLPDLDFAWGRHNMETHSVAFALLTGSAAWWWWRSWRLAAACMVAGLTHVLFDWLGSDDFPPLGVMALWPISQAFYFAEAYVFATISRRYWLPGFWSHNLWSVLRELAILMPIAVLAHHCRRRRGMTGPRASA